ncbi:DNA/RNA non-specific endonuclease [Psychrobacter sp. I-STPA10]|uniref:DNA/RNA non-specific endonuclease n=1 Tax=Psychrobacter sp. I-STPA10 TaxID=2585769 RepID=UPI001E55D023|nr:DNA/RNA non-specific endonuclease [Psychrobacter sp. I-STPA10]
MTIFSLQPYSPSTTHTQYLQSLLSVILALMCFAIWQPAQANDFQDCPQNFYAGTPPTYTNKKLNKDSVALCFNGFATLYSGISRTPVWSAEHLTRQRLLDAEEIPRDDSFHEESRLPQSMRAKLSDYKHSGYDRGHLAPNADMASVAQQYDSFSLANIAPQSPKNNRYVWRNLESVTRYLTKQYGETYVITGVAFEGKKITQLNRKVMIPTHFFKAVYIPATGEAGVYYAPNDESERVEVISVNELALRTGIDIMPAISPVAQAEAKQLPYQVSDINQEAEDTTTDEPWWLQLVVEVLQWLISTIFK